MIRYAVLTKAALEALVDAEDAGWRTRADIRRNAFIAAGKFEEEASIWSDVKTVFMDLQYRKCVFCERVLGGKKTGKSEHDVEHFRPKGRVLAWPTKGRMPSVPYTFNTGLPSGTGYYWLAYDIENYACACKSCNSDRKRDYFPILGPRGAATDAIAALNASEIPLLLFPHGPLGDDPAEFITFEGVLAKPLHQNGLANLRARITIDFFDLNGREELLADRARVIRELLKTIELAETGSPALRAAAARDLQLLLSEKSPQTACARAYEALVRVDYEKAWEIYLDIHRYLQ